MSNPSQTLPSDRSHVLTEQRNPRSMNLHELSVAELVQLLNDEDRRLADAMDRARPALTAFIEDAEPRFTSNGGSGRLVYIGAGTSGRLGVLDASEMPPTFQVPPDRVIGIIAGGDDALRKSSEGKEDERDGAIEQLQALNLTAKDTLLGIAAGGTTPYVQGGLEFAKTLPSPPLTGFLLCTPLEPLPYVDHMIVIESGPEIVTGSTRMKAGTVTKLALNIISTSLMVRSGRVYENLMVDLRASNEKLKDRAARIIGMMTGLDRDACFELLNAASGEVKTAAVMNLKGVSCDEAIQRLKNADGKLHLALGNDGV